MTSTITRRAEPVPDEFPQSPRRVPVVLQMEAVECGAACLGMILGFHGKYLPLEELRTACGVSRDGSKAANILRAARGYGMKAQGERIGAGHLNRAVLPAIIFWQNRHFMVLEGASRGRLLLTDPASGQRVLTPGELADGFSGILLTFETTDEFVKSGQLPSIWKSCWELLRGSEGALMYLVMTSCMLVLPAIVLPAFIRIFIDKVLDAQFFDWLSRLLVAMVIMGLLRAFIMWLHEYCINSLRHKLALVGATRFVWHVLRLPMDFFAARFRGDLAARVLLNDRIADTLAIKLAGRMNDVIAVVVLTIVMFTYDVVLTLIGLGFIALSYGLMYWGHSFLDPEERRLHQAQSRVLGTLTNGLASISTVKASGQESFFYDLYSGHRAREVNLQQRVDLYRELLAIVPGLISFVSQSSILIVGGHRYLHSEISLGMLVAQIFLVNTIMRPVHRLMESAGLLGTLKTHVQRINDVMGHRLDSQIQATSRGMPGSVVNPAEDLFMMTSAPRIIQGRVEFRNVTFGYSRLEPPMLQDLSFIVEPGQRVAFVGPSGCGKSTIAKLITGLYEPWSGEILIDGYPRTSYARDYLSGAVAAVDQSPVFMAGTVRENLTLWDSTVPHVDIVRACKDAVIHDALSVREEGYDGRMEENGSNFSGGERQRMEIARALIRWPRILVLDEATSAVDALVEIEIDDRIRMRGCTCLIIAHRISTIRDADEILVFKQGKIIQRGRHDELKDEPGFYAEILDE
ncbi:MAG: NHLP family bacteriocin export ABC transporter peptidase/permease/ATPase subunit [Candidatus Methylacidiphilales bacterium]|nr:NHLP family bacteriocin export ABC transporter peptidase/permease/ATPase subunit [Candidatus Methylacidiphilales bacterium]